jgi:hypothetical protein
VAPGRGQSVNLRRADGTFALMDVVVALHASAALLVLVAGLAKVVRPDPTSDLLATLGLPSGSAVSATIGVGESALGIAALVVGGPATAALVGALYVAFVIVVVRAMRAGASSCGCFGRVDAPPSWIHVAGNTGFASISFVAIVGDSPIDVMDGQRAGGAAFVAMVGVVAGLAFGAFTARPKAPGARRP